MNWSGTVMLAAGAMCLLGLPAQAQTCTALRTVDGPGTQVQKKVSPPPAGVTRSNWNTDFAVPSGVRYSRYVATIVPQNQAEYQVQLNLKYADDSSSKVYDRAVSLPRGRAFTIAGAPRVDANPYQVNVVVGGIRAVGNTYTVSVAGCR